MKDVIERVVPSPDGNDPPVILSTSRHETIRPSKFLLLLRWMSNYTVHDVLFASGKYIIYTSVFVCCANDLRNSYRTDLSAINPLLH